MWFDVQAARAALEGGRLPPSPPPEPISKIAEIAAPLAEIEKTAPTPEAIEAVWQAALAAVAKVRAEREAWYRLNLHGQGPSDDDAAYLAHIKAHGAATYGVTARALGWGATRAWQTEAWLREAGLLVYDDGGKARAHDWL